MKDIQAYLKRGDVIEGTLLNDHNEAWYLGPVKTIKPQKNNHYFKWSVDGKLRNVFPFTTLVIHVGSSIIDTVGLSRNSYQEGKVVELYYGRH
jgi:hypothetical protein